MYNCTVQYTSYTITQTMREDEILQSIFSISEIIKDYKKRFSFRTISLLNIIFPTIFSQEKQQSVINSILAVSCRITIHWKLMHIYNPINWKRKIREKLLKSCSVYTKVKHKILNYI